MQKSDIEDSSSSSNTLIELNGEVVTVYLFGTSVTKKAAFSRTRYFNGETVSSIAHNTLAVENETKITIEGVGCNDGLGDRWTKQKHYLPIQGILKARGRTQALDHVIAVLLRGYTEVSRYTPSQDAQKIKIKEYFGELKPIKQVIILGWSRGVPAAITLANWMKYHPALESIQVKIIGIDPVPGFARTKVLNTELSSNVTEFVAFYAEDDRSGGFLPVVPTLAKGNTTTKIRLFSMPGHHATLVGNANKHNGKPIKGYNFEASGKLVRDFVEKTLQEWGTKLTSSYDYDDGQLQQLFAELASNARGYRLLRNEAYIFRQSRRNSYRKAHWGAGIKGKTTLDKIPGIKRLAISDFPNKEIPAITQLIENIVKNQTSPACDLTNLNPQQLNMVLPYVLKQSGIKTLVLAGNHEGEILKFLSSNKTLTEVEIAGDCSEEILHVLILASSNALRPFAIYVTGEIECSDKYWKSVEPVLKNLADLAERHTQETAAAKKVSTDSGKKLNLNTNIDWQFFTTRSDEKREEETPISSSSVSLTSSFESSSE